MAGNVTSLFRDTAAAGPVDFCVPCNPYFPTPGMFEEIAARLREIVTYYPSDAETITAELCDLLQLPPQCVVMGNGTTELITWIDHLLVRESLAVPVPTSGRWTDQPMETGKRVDMFPLQEASGFALDLGQYADFIRARGTRTAVICNPSNPDGGFLGRQALVQFMDAMTDLDLIVVDESFLEFADAEPEPSVVQEALLRPNVVVLRSLGKNFGLHGIRFGYLVANPALAGRVRTVLPRWNLNSLAEHVVFMLREHGPEYAQSLLQVRRDRLEMTGRLSALPGLTVFPSQGNFLFVRLPVGAEGTVVRDRMLAEHRILVRECGDKIGSSSRFLRLVVRPQADVRRLVSGLEQVLYGTRRGAAVPGPGTGTSYSSGTAAVDRLVNETNGSGLHLTAAVPPPAVGTGMPLPAAIPTPTPVQQPAPRMPQPVAAAQQPVPSPAPVPTPPPAPVPAPVTAPAVALGPTPPGVPARGGLTAAQVRGMTAPGSPAPAPAPGPVPVPGAPTGLTPAPATGWPHARSWPDAQSRPSAGGMGQTG